MPTNRQLFLQHLGQTTMKPLMLEIERAEGVFMYGSDGRKYLDLISGVSVSNTGHCHPDVVKAVSDQAGTYMHLMVYGEIIQSPQVKYAGKLISLLPEKLDNCYFVNSGSEAVEGALKLAKRYTGRSRIISFRNAYHGSTHGALSIQGSEYYRNAFRPLLPDTFQIPFNNFEALDAIDEHCACVIIEPVQGEGGVIWPVKGFLEKIRNRCTENGTLLIYDEIQTGFGRLGSMFAIDRFGVVPDIIVLAKALGGGMPLGAFVSSREIMLSIASLPSLGHITTFGGHPVSCAAGLASLNVILKEKLAEKCQEKGRQFKQELKHRLISEIRGEGLLLAVKLTNKNYIPYVITNAPEYGLVLDYFLFCDDSFRIAPPLVISKSEISLACSQLIRLLDETEKRIQAE
ncbi:MAG: aspartate aminotransferase family protein [Bacteroidales bacterium]